ncbi:hypothetical protein [Streptomyces wuyuanensis]|uniref:Uncharacterized protein n=1 Tax=Streptomyces wuyuanensis TaxID=1196353 RepID=A0A1G9Z9H4_9ACTN|nr:hypothetical protein [Streptomyces wuyuanensis]SDN18000.1 hypothetical protein SAMN05444921_12134 [Streptomyces wuyuanensis]
MKGENANAEATSRQIRMLGADKTHPGLSELALSLARAADEADAPTALAAVAAQLRAVMKDLCSLATSVEEGDALDDLASRRAKRRGA